MPGDWIKVRTELPRDPRVARIARECQSNAAHVVGSLVIIWTSISETSLDGLLPAGIGDCDLDHMGLLPGLSKSMRSVGWLETDEPSGLLRLPDFTRYIGSAKERANARERQRDSRAGRPPPPERNKPPLSQNVTVTSRDGPVTKRDCHTENENEIENESEIKNTPSAVADPVPVGFGRFWAAWPKHERKTGKKKCLGIWRRVGLEKRADEMVKAVETWKKTDSWTKESGAYIPMPETWLNRGSYDEVPEKSSPAPGKPNFYLGVQ